MLERETAAWQDYELLETGGLEKLERFGDIVMVRPEPQALWRKVREHNFASAHLIYSRQGREGDWAVKKPVPDAWTVSWEDLKFRIRPTTFKHTGLFPEQASNWAYIRSKVTSDMNVMNLFGYTGGATVAAASVGADITHVDASKPVVTWTRENLDLSGFGEKPVRLIVDDAQSFVAREVRREKKYDAIFMDPPAFGRGPEGELWKFETHLPSLIEDCVKLLKPERGILIVNAYSLGFPALAVENTVRAALPWSAEISSVELTLKESTERGFALPTGVVIRAEWGL